MLTTREEWLNAIAADMSPLFEALGYPLPKYRIAIGFTSRGTRGKALGECWTASASADAHHEILLRPDKSDALEVAAILAHELTHAAVGLGCGHKGPFVKVIRGLGLSGKATATVAGEKFIAAMTPILAAVGPLPHAALDFNTGVTTGAKKQGTRLIKCECTTCGFTVRATRKWLDVGAPHCPLHGPMTGADE